MSGLWAVVIPQEDSKAGSEIVQNTKAHFFIQMTQFSLLQVLREKSAVHIIPFEKGKGKKANRKTNAQ